MELILQVIFSSVFSGLLLSAAIPNEVYLFGCPVFTLFAFIPLYLIFNKIKDFKTAFEKDNLNTKVQELNDKVNSLEKKNENLLRENEKLKNEKNMLRSRGYNKNTEFKFGSHLGVTAIGSKKYDYSSSYNNAMLKALDKSNNEDIKETEKEKEKDSNEKQTKFVSSSTGNKNTGAKTTTTTTSAKTVNEKKEAAKKK
jgi:outer membrane murein-binding lipoprotein Lpp